MNRSTRPRLLLVLAFAAAAVLAALAFFILPLRKQSARLVAEEQALLQRITEADLMYRSLPRVKEDIADLKSRISALSRSEPNPTPSVVRGIERLAADLGIQLTSIRPAEPEYADECMKFPTTFEVQSSFPEIVRLLYDLERPPYNLWVEGAEVQADREGGTTRAAVTVSVYSCQPESKAADEKN